MAQQPPHPGAAQAANINPKDVAPSNMNSRQQQAVADVVAHDAAKGANVYVSDFFRSQGMMGLGNMVGDSCGSPTTLPWSSVLRRPSVARILMLDARHQHFTVAHQSIQPPQRLP